MTFPEWVPEELCRYWQKQYSGKKHISHLRQELLRRLLTDNRMKRVWSEIGKGRKLRPNGKPDKMFYPEFLLQVNTALLAYQQERKTRTETDKQYARIAEACRKAAKAVKGSRLDSTPYRYYRDDIIGDLLSRMPPELAEDTFCLINPLPGTSKEHVWLGAHTLSRLDGSYALRDGSYALLGLLPFGTSSAGFFECLLGLGHRHPTLSAIAEAAAKDADTRAKEAKTEYRLLGKPGQSNTVRLAFIRSMAGYFVREFGDPLKRTLAALSTVVLESVGLSETIPEDVKNALRGVKFPTYGGAGDLENRAALSQVRRFFELHGESRFTPWDMALTGDSRTINRAGFSRMNQDGTEFYVFPEVFKTEICAGFDSGSVAKEMVRRGWLMAGKEGKTTRSERLPGMGSTTRCYRFTSRLMEAVFTRG